MDKLTPFQQELVNAANVYAAAFAFEATRPANQFNNEYTQRRYEKFLSLVERAVDKKKLRARIDAYKAEVDKDD